MPARTESDPEGLRAALASRVEELESEVRALRRALASRREGERRTAPVELALLVALGDQTAALAADQVVEVVRYVELAPVSDVHASVAGLLNLRGRLIPVLDGRARLGLRAAAPTLTSAIVVLDAPGGQLGLVVDRAPELVMLPAGALTEPSEPLSDATAIAAVGAVGGRSVCLLDVAALLPPHRRAELEGAAAEHDDGGDAAWG